MIVWSRWGILLLPVIGAGILAGFLIGAIVTAISGGTFPQTLFLGVGLVIGGGFIWLFDHFAMPHLDRARPHVVTQALPQPVVHPNGVRQTHQQVPVLDPRTGQQIWVRPRSTLFFAPVSVWPYVIAGIGLVVTISAAVRLIAG